MSIPWYDDAAGQFLAGVAISFADRAFSKNAKRHSAQRYEEKIDQVTALEYLLQTERNGQKENVVHSPEYTQAIDRASDYFKSQRIPMKSSIRQGTRNVLGNLVDIVRFYKGNERINTLPAKKTLLAAFSIEFIGDSVVAISQLAAGYGHAISSLGKSMYQAPALFAGLQTGKGILYLKDKLNKSKEEKAAERMAAELVRDGTLLGIVNAYSLSPIRYMQTEEMPTDKPVIQLSNEEIGRKAGEALVTVAKGAQTVARVGLGAVRSYIRTKVEESAAKEKEAQQKRKDKYDKY